MNKIVIGILSFLGGAAIGGATGYFVTKAICNRKFNDALDREIEPYLKKAGKVKVEPTEETEAEDPDIQEHNNQTVVADLDNVEKVKDRMKSKQKQMSEEYKRYAAAANEMAEKEYGTTDEKKAVNPEKEAGDHIDEDPKAIYEIEEDAFTDPDDPRYRSDYDHVYVSFYDVDCVFAFDDNDRKIDYPETFFGNVEIDFDTSHEGVYVIRNNPKATDYWISFNAGSYEEEVLGLYKDDEPHDWD